MYAVIETGSKQYKVAVGDKLRIEKLSANKGDVINLAHVLMVADGDHIDVGTPFVDSPVTATVLGHGRGDKIRVFKMKRRKNYRRTQGHRQDFTEIEVTRIGDAESGDAGSVNAAESASEAEPSAERSDDADELTRIDGIGPTDREGLLALGVTTFRQIAEFDEAMIAEVDSQLNLEGRIEREEWVAQAKALVAQQASGMTDTEGE